ncbi:hypothetical protein K2X33_14385 [bacterium]|nr:hypothetical protein [bacterium]
MSFSKVASHQSRFLTVGCLACILTQGAWAHYRAFTTVYPPAYSVKGMEWISRFEYFHAFDYPTKTHRFTEEGHAYQVSWDAAEMVLTVEGRGEKHRLEFAPLLESLRPLNPEAARSLPQNRLTLESRLAHSSVRVNIEDIAAEWREKSPVVYHLKAEVLWGHSTRPRS